MLRKGFKGMFLHAKSINIKIQNQYFEFESRLPASWDKIMSEIVV